MTANERKSRVKHLKAQKLSEFIDYADALEKPAVSVPANETKSKKSNKPQPIEYQQIDMEALHSSILEAGGYDDKPLIFLGNENYTKHLLGNPQQVQEIIKSFNNFREIIDSMTHEEEHEYETHLNTFGESTKEHGITEEVIDPLETLEPYVENAPAVARSKSKASNIIAAAEATGKKSRQVNEIQLRKCLLIY